MMWSHIAPEATRQWKKEDGNRRISNNWFARNGMKRNSSKYQTMVLGKNKGTDDEPVFRCDESQLPISNTIEPLGVTIDDK